MIYRRTPRIPPGEPFRIMFSDRENDYLLGVVEGRYLRLTEINGAPFALIPCPILIDEAALDAITKALA